MLGIVGLMLSSSGEPVDTKAVNGKASVVIDSQRRRQAGRPHKKRRNRNERVQKKFNKPSEAPQNSSTSSEITPVNLEAVAAATAAADDDEPIQVGPVIEIEEVQVPFQNGFDNTIWQQASIQDVEDRCTLTPLGGRGITTVMVTNGHHIHHAATATANVDPDPDWNAAMQSYSTHTKYPIQLAKTDVTFFIESNVAGKPFEVSQFAVQISSPKTKLGLPVRAAEDDYQDEHLNIRRQRFRCSFRPTEPGFYPVTISLRSAGQFGPDRNRDRQINGSPLLITVARNYSADMNEAVRVQMMVEPVVVELSPIRSSLMMPFQTIWSPSTSLAEAEAADLGAAFYYNQLQAGAGAGAGPADQSQMDPLKSKPWGITYCPKTDEIFVATRDTHEIQKFDAGSGRFLDRFGKHGGGPDCFYRPTGIVYDAVHSRLAISDKDNHRISFFTVTGHFMATFGSRGHRDGELSYPWGLDVSRDGQYIVVADSRNHRIQLFDKLGLYISKYSIFEQNPFEYKTMFNYPRAVCFDNTGHYIYVSDFNLGQVFMLGLDLDLNFDTLVPIAPPGNLLRPQGLAVDIAGSIIICDSKHDCLRVVCANGALLTTVHGFGAALQPDETPNPDYEGLDGPIDVCLVGGGKVAILDATGVIRIF